jgi:hypothetical protein
VHGKQVQFAFGNGKFCKATIQADHKLRKYPDVGLVNVFQATKMDGNLARELAQILGTTSASLSRWSGSWRESGAPVDTAVGAKQRQLSLA